MYKLLVVDDFDIDRKNIKKCINWNNMGVEIIEASNGNEALDIMQKVLPDFILTDVQMPFMDGIELARKVREVYPCIKVIFFSYYNDFEYVKSAVDLNVHGYILKPIIPEEILNCFNKVINQLQQEKEKQEQDLRIKKLLEETKPLLVERFLKNLFSGTFIEEDEVWARCQYLSIPLKKGYYRGVVIEVDDELLQQNKKSIEDLHIFNIKFSNILNECCNRCNIDIVTQIDDSRYAVILNHIQATCMSEISEKLFNEISLILPMCDGKITAGVSDVTSDLMELPELYRQCIYALRFKFCFGRGVIINYNDIHETSNIPEIRLNKLQEEIRFIIYKSDNEEIDKYVDDLFEDIVIDSDSSYIKNICFSVIICAQLVLQEINSDFESVFVDEENIVWNKLLKFETIVDLKQWLKSILKFTASYFTNVKNKKNDKITGDIIQYLEEHYKNNITVKDVSDKFYFTPNYLNYIFKNKTGKTIPEYITELRIGRARELLRERKLKISEIVEAVGYTRASYFAGLFKKYTGFTPKEYREK